MSRPGGGNTRRVTLSGFSENGPNECAGQISARFGLRKEQSLIDVESKIPTFPRSTSPAAEVGLSVPQTRHVTHPPLFRSLLPEITGPRHERQDAAIDDESLADDEA